MISKYRRGEVSPTAAKLLRVEATIPGSANVYHSALWDLCEKPYVNPSDLRRLAFALDPDVGALLVEDGATLASTFWRREDDVESTIEALGKLNVDEVRSLDVVAASLLLVHESTHRQQIERSMKSCMGAMQHIDAAARTSPLICLVAPLTDAFLRTCVDDVLSSPRWSKLRDTAMGLRDESVLLNS